MARVILFNTTSRLIVLEVVQMQQQGRVINNDWKWLKIFDIMIFAWSMPKDKYYYWAAKKVGKKCDNCNAAIAKKWDLCDNCELWHFPGQCSFWNYKNRNSFKTMIIFTCWYHRQTVGMSWSMGKPLEHIVRCRPLKPRKDEQDMHFSEK